MTSRELKALPMLQWKDRIGYRKVASFTNNDEWYSWLINDWIPNQPDSRILMRLFIGMGFNPAAWLCVVRWRKDWITKYREFADRRASAGKEK